MIGGNTIRLDPADLKTRWESKCDPSKGCQTACCHFEGSPCEHLRWKDQDKKIGTCSIYEQRFGRRKTVDGKEFLCAPMSEFLKHKPAPEKCGYANVTSVDGVPVVRGLA